MRTPILFAFACLVGAPCSAQTTRGDFMVHDRLGEYVEAARGLSFKSRVRGFVMSAREFARLNRSDPVAGGDTPCEGPELGWKALGLLPNSVDLEQALEQDAEETSGGFYVQDPMPPFPRGSLVLIRRHPEEDLDVVAAHELVHALHDQVFDLGRLAEGIPHTSTGAPEFDAELASEALEEGVATLVGDAIAARLQRRRPPAPPAEDSSQASDWIEAMGQFPYVEGVRFAAALQRRGQRTIDRAYARVPASSEQILHPERYFAGDVPARVQLPDFKRTLPGSWELISENDLGEFGLRRVVGAQAAAGWDGDRYQALREQSTGRVVVVWHTTWDTIRDAGEFRLAAAMSPLLQGGLVEGRSLLIQQRQREVFLALGVVDDQREPLLRESLGVRVEKQAGDDDAWPARAPARDPLQAFLLDSQTGEARVTKTRGGQTRRTLTLPLDAQARQRIMTDLQRTRVPEVSPGRFRLGPGRHVQLGPDRLVIQVQTASRTRLPG